MCLHCEEHVGKIWYLQGQSHTHSNWLTDLVDQAMYQKIVLPGLQSVASRQPYGSERWTGVTRALWDWVTKRLHGFQVLPDLDSAVAVISKANEIGLSICSCRKILAPDQPEAWKCIGLNSAAKITFRQSSQPFRAITKQQAMDILAEQRQKGCMLTVGWRLGAYVNWLCACDQWCGAHRAPELEWGLVPSFLVSHLVKPESCDGCQVCKEWCLRPGALAFDGNGQAVIDEALCRGCGLCIEHCPTGALGYVPRRVIFDIATGRKMELPAKVTRV